MTCLVHNSRYRALFHAVVNELRQENKMSVSSLRNMPKKCCTCYDIDNITFASVLINEKEKLNNLKKLTDQIDQEKQNNPKLSLALIRLENFIQENRNDLTSNVPSTVKRENSTESKENNSMDIDKPLKNGTFLFLPYKFEEKPNSSSLLQVAKTLQRGRFIGRNGYISSLENQQNVCINMITPSTSRQITYTLRNAREGVGNAKIHNQDVASQGIDGEWLLVRAKKTDKQADTTDFEELLNDLQDRWESFLKIKKRKSEDDEDDEHVNKK